MPTTLQQSVTTSLIVALFVESSLYAVDFDCRMIIIIACVQVTMNGLKNLRYHQLTN
jgi:hypothetical protein